MILTGLYEELDSIKNSLELIELSSVNRVRISWANETFSLLFFSQSFTGSLSVKKRFGGGSRRQIEVPLLFQWLARFHATLVSKFSLYFHATLSEQTTQSEMKNLTAKANIDYVNKYVYFSRFWLYTRYPFSPPN